MEFELKTENEMLLISLRKLRFEHISKNSADITVKSSANLNLFVRDSFQSLIFMGYSTFESKSLIVSALFHRTFELREMINLKMTVMPSKVNTLQILFISNIITLLQNESLNIHSL